MWFVVKIRATSGNSLSVRPKCGRWENNNFMKKYLKEYLSFGIIFEVESLYYIQLLILTYISFVLFFLQVIQALLHKYNVTDNPKKFALYEKHNNLKNGEKEGLFGIIHFYSKVYLKQIHNHESLHYLLS